MMRRMELLSMEMGLGWGGMTNCNGSEKALIPPIVFKKM